MDKAKAPVFVVGCPSIGLQHSCTTRSCRRGILRCTWLRATFNRIAPVFGDLRLRFKDNRAEVDEHAASKRSLQENWIPPPARFPRRSYPIARNAGDFLRIVMERTAQKQGVERWADNTPSHVLHIPRIKKTIPNALFIHIVRDGRDVATSLSHLGWPFEPRRPWDRDHGLLISALFWEWMVRKGREGGWQIGSDYLEVRYEAILGTSPQRDGWGCSQRIYPSRLEL